jgi:FkbH-like protein
LTTRRHSANALQQFASRPDCVHLSFRLTDRLADHGLVALVIAFQNGDALDVDTWLMSCRVIGRSLEATMAQELARAAGARDCNTVVATYVPSERNALAAGILSTLGFRQVDDQDGATRWAYGLNTQPPIVNEHIVVRRSR